MIYLKIKVKFKKHKDKTIEFSDYANFNAWLFSKGENRWISVSIDFNATITKPIFKDRVMATEFPIHKPIRSG